MRIAIIGGGIAGISAAYKLQHNHQVSLFETSSELGGHANGVEVEPGVFADTGVIIYNEGSYPEFIKFLKELEVEDSCFRMEMSISFNNLASGRCFSVGTKPFPLVGALKHLFHPKTFKVLRELWRFHKNGKSYLEEVRGSGTDLLSFMRDKRYSPVFLDELLFPLAMSVWSLPRGYFREIEAEVFFAFLDHHRFLGGSLKNFRWYTFSGSTRMYIEKFISLFKGEIYLSTQVKSVKKIESGVVLEFVSEREAEVYDHVILATHADTALTLLTEPSKLERSTLGMWKYHTTKVYLHQDSTFAPVRPVRGSWNIFFGEHPTQEWITYDINRIQKLKASKNYYVTLSNEKRPTQVIKEMEYSHPIYDRHTTSKFEALRELNQDGPLSFCGSYFGYGFHEDAIKSANKVAKGINDE